MSAHIPSHYAAPLEVAGYVKDMAAQLETIATAARLDLLAYFLGMAKTEGDLLVRCNAQVDGSKVDHDDKPASPQCDHC
jgi:hypothetical protein